MPDILIPNNSLHDVATFNILVDGIAMDPSFQLLSLSVSMESNRIPQAKMVFRDGDAAEQTFTVSDNNFFTPGKKIAIGIGHDSSNTEVFRGTIIKHAIKVKTNGAS